MRTDNGNDPELSRMLSALPKVSAPADFDARLRSRIALRRPIAGARWFRPAVVAAALASLVFGSYFALRPEKAPMLAEAYVQGTAPAIVSLGSGVQRDEPAPVEVPARRTAKTGAASVPFRPEPRTPAGSVDLSSRTSEPRRIDSGGGLAPRRSVTFERPASIPAAGLLSELGIETTPENGRLRVASVRPNSLAERSGVRMNDVVEVLDETPITADTNFTKSAEGKSLTVRRDGRTIRLVLRAQ